MKGALFSKKNSLAFTLAELLLAIGIIGFLCVLVFSATGKLSARSDLLKCTSNLHQFAVAMGNFSADHKGAWAYPDDYRENVDPLGTWISRPVKHEGAWQALGKLFPYIRDRRVYICPADKVKLAVLHARGEYASEEGTFSNDYVTRGVNQSRFPGRPNLKFLSTMGRRSIVSCNFAYSSSSPKSFPLSWHEGAYPVLFSDGSVRQMRFPAGAVNGSPPDINNSTGLQIKIWDYFDGLTDTLILN